MVELTSDTFGLADDEERRSSDSYDDDDYDELITFSSISPSFVRGFFVNE